MTRRRGLAEEPTARTRPFVVSTRRPTAGTINTVRLIGKTIDGWNMAASWPARRRRRFRLGLVLHLVGLRQLAVRVAGVPAESTGEVRPGD
jgi:hypothetical protein